MLFIAIIIAALFASYFVVKASRLKPGESLIVGANSGSTKRVVVKINNSHLSRPPKYFGMHCQAKIRHLKRKKLCL